LRSGNAGLDTFSGHWIIFHRPLSW